jgi:hypothetical protein
MPFFTDVVRLLKDWKKEQDVPLKSIHLELIASDTYDCYLDDAGITALKDNDIPWLLDQCLDNILGCLSGNPIIPSSSKYCDYDDFNEKYALPFLIDPANPADNLLSRLEKADIKKTRMKVKTTRKNLKEGNYDAIFNRGGLLKNYTFN